jgi:PASTA domain
VPSLVRRRASAPVDDNDSEVTFNPASPGTPSEVQIDNAPLIGSNSWGVQDIACPSATQCTGVDSQSSEVTFNPQSPPGTQNPQTIDTNTASNSNYEYLVSCPSLTQCTAIDGINTEITFDPGTSPWTSKPTIITTHAFANSFNIGGLACPSTTQCTDVYTYPGGGTNSYEVTFNPTNPGNPSPVALNFYATPSYAFGSIVSCPSVTQCTVSGGDSNGNTTDEVTFNPQAPGTPNEKLTPESGVISCPSVNECVMIDAYGDVVLGTPSSGGSSGSTKCVVPKVKGKTLAAAKTAIVKAHCTVGKIKKASSEHVKKGHVISQNPPSGRSLSSAAKVNLVVSKG